MVFWTMLVILFALVALGIAAAVGKKFFEERALGSLSQKVSNFGVSMGLSGLALFFFRQQSVPVLGWRIWFLVWLLSLVIWAARILRYYFNRVPQIRAEKVARQEKEKYFPQAK